MNEQNRPPDELEMRLRDLEAERLRPTPKRPRPPLYGDAEALLRRLRRQFPHWHGDDDEEAVPDGPAMGAAGHEPPP